MGGGPPLGPLSFAADPNGEVRFLIRFGVKGDIVEAIVKPFETRSFFFPELLEHLELLVGNLSSLLERSPQGFEFLGHPTHSDSQDQSTFGELIDRGCHFGPVEWMSIGKHEHTHPEQDLLRAAREKGQAGEGF